MFKTFVISLAALLVAGTLVFAHGAPIMGTVSAMSSDSMTVTTTDGKTIVIGLEKTTKYLKDKKAVTMQDLKVGDRVVIDAHMDEKTKSYKAESVQIGTAAATKAPAKKAPKPRQ